MRDAEVVQLVVDTLAAMERLRERIGATAEPDPVTQDLLIAVTSELEKQRWMFDAENWPRDE